MDRSKRNCATRGSASRRGGCPPTSSRRRRPAAAVASPRWHRAALWEWWSMGSAPDRHGSEARSIARSRLRRPAAGSSHGRSGNHARTEGPGRDRSRISDRRSLAGPAKEKDPIHFVVPGVASVRPSSAQRSCAEGPSTRPPAKTSHNQTCVLRPDVALILVSSGLLDAHGSDVTRWSRESRSSFMEARVLAIRIRSRSRRLWTWPDRRQQRQLPSLGGQRRCRRTE